MNPLRVMEELGGLGPGDVLIVTDIQNDFLPGGSLPVPGGGAVIDPLNAAIREFRERKLPVIATRDWHPPDHCSFRERGGPWPAHCVRGTAGASFHPDLQLPPGALVVSKATDPEKEAYSAFEGTDLEKRLSELEICRIFIGGLATEYCVLNTVKDAIRLDYEVAVLGRACRGIDLRPGDAERALGTMRQLGASVI